MEETVIQKLSDQEMTDLQQDCDAPEVSESSDTEPAIAGAEDSTELDRSQETTNSDASSSNTWHSSDISLPTMSTFRPIYTCPFMPTLTSWQILLSFPALQQPGAILQNKCAKCCHYYASEETLVAHVLEGIDGDFSCRRFYQKWRQYREDHKNQKKKSLGKQRFPQYPGLSIHRNKKDADDDSIQNQSGRHRLKRRKNEEEDLCYPPKKQFSNDLLQWVLCT